MRQVRPLVHKTYQMHIQAAAEKITHQTQSRDSSKKGGASIAIFSLDQSTKRSVLKVLTLARRQGPLLDLQWIRL